MARASAETQPYKGIHEDAQAQRAKKLLTAFAISRERRGRRSLIRVLLCGNDGLLPAKRHQMWGYRLPPQLDCRIAPLMRPIAKQIEMWEIRLAY